VCDPDGVVPARERSRLDRRNQTSCVQVPGFRRGRARGCNQVGRSQRDERGPEGEDVVSSGDPVADNNGREDFTRRYDQMHRLAYNDRGQVIVYVGADNWPLPIPIVKQGSGWVFDTAEGKDELLYRRIGRNELYTIDVLQELADAQQDYADLQKQSTGEASFAPKILSDPDKKNGLYWPTSAAEPESPIGPLIADASAEGYKRDPRDVQLLSTATTKKCWPARVRMLRVERWTTSLTAR
jgi:Protein of unknown function (DUF2950)